MVGGGGAREHELASMNIDVSTDGSIEAKFHLPGVEAFKDVLPDWVAGEWCLQASTRSFSFCDGFSPGSGRG